MSDLYITIQKADSYDKLVAEIKKRLSNRTVSHGQTTNDLDRTFELGMMMELNSLIHWEEEERRSNINVKR